MPVYNAEEYLAEAIESILNQSFTDFELLIFNDASTDQSLDIIKGYSDSRIHVIDCPVNEGIVKRLNDGIALAKGQYIARMDADDISLPLRFEIQIKLLDEHPEVGLCGTWHEYIGDLKGVHKYPVTPRDIRLQLLFNTAFSHPTVMMRKSILTENELMYDEGFVPAEDYNLWVRILTRTQAANVPQVLLKYRVHGSSISMSKKRKQQQRASLAREFQIRHVFGVQLYDEADLIFLAEVLGTIGAENIRKMSRREFVLIEDFCSLLRERILEADSHKEEMLKGIRFLANDLYCSSLHLNRWLIRRAIKSKVFSITAFIQFSIKRTFPHFYEKILLTAK